MTPKAKLLVYYTRKNGEIVADAITFSIDDIFQTTVSLIKSYIEPVVSLLIISYRYLYIRYLIGNYNVRY